MITLSSSKINDIHKKMIFRFIWEEGKVSRSQIGKVFGLSKSTVSGIVRELIEEGLIVENGWKNSSGGRRSELLSLNPCGPLILSVFLKDGGEGEVAVINLLGTVLDKRHFYLSSKEDAKETAIKISSFLRVFLSSYSETCFLGIGLGVPGIVDHKQGRISYSAHLGWREVPLSKMIISYLPTNLPLIISNRTIAATLGEMWFGKGKETQNFICINSGEAVGAGIVIDGHVYRGLRGGAGEVGHVALLPGEKVCSCGKRGCIESAISLYSLMKELGEEYQGETASADFLRERKNDLRIQELLYNAFSLIGELSALLINVLAPEKIILTGEMARIDPENLLRLVRKEVGEKALGLLADGVEIEVSNLDREQEVLWGAALVMENIFSLPHLSKK